MIKSYKHCFIEKSTHAIPITLLHERDYAAWLATQSTLVQTWVKTHAFDPTKGMILSIPDHQGHLTHIIAGLMHDQDTFVLARAAALLPAGEYQLQDMPFYAQYPCCQSPLFYLAWGLEQYRFSHYKPTLAAALLAKFKALVVPSHQLKILQTTLNAVYHVRDLINTPAQDMNPETLENVLRTLAKKHHATVHSIIGDDLLKANFPAIHAVGRASVFQPRFIELTWGNSGNPAVTLVGKGVCFDTGGLDLKPAAGMLIMKKDMSGSAQVIGLATLIMETNLPIYLRVLIPAVENAVSGNAYHPGDIITTRKGLTVSIDNTDAEGRVVLSDAIAYAMETPPECLIDIASLTGASTAAVGYDIATFYTNQDTCAQQLTLASQRVSENLWRMPLHALYKETIMPEIADLANSSCVNYAGSITAALFLQEFADVANHPEMTWIHFDTSAWNDKARPGKPIGGEATVVRSLYEYLVDRFGSR